MILKISAVRDSAMNAFNRPIYVPAEGLAIRSFTDEVNRAASDNPMNVHSKDFALYYLGEFDETSGEFITELPRLCVQADQVKMPA